MRPFPIKSYKKPASEKRQTVEYIIFLIGYAPSSFRNFESCLRFVVALDEDDIQIISSSM